MMLQQSAGGRDHGRCGRAIAIGLAVVLMGVGVPRAGQGKPRPKGQTDREIRACAATHTRAQELERAGHLRQASLALATCARAACGAFIQHECTVRHAQLEAEMPSVVPLASDAAGLPLLDVQVTMDGQALASRLDGRAIAIDPGLHEFVFRLPGGTVVTEKIVIAQGQRNRPLAVGPEGARPGDREGSASRARQPADEAPKATPDFAMPAALRDSAPAAPSTSASVPLALEDPTDTHEAPAATASRSLVAPILFGLVGVAGVGGYGVLTQWGRRDNDRLAECSPDCAQVSVDHVRRLYLGADVSLGVGLAALATTSWLVFRPAPTAERSSHAPSAKARGLAATHFDLRPTGTGASASIGGQF
jgi:hypothetical protein